MRLLVDGDSLGWRTHATQGHLRDQGIPTGMAFGFLRSLRVLVEAVRPQACRVIWDGGKSAFRLATWPAYKTRRTARPPEERAEYQQQVAWLTQVLPLLGVAIERAPGWEADDVIAAAALLGQFTTPMMIASGDRDFWQLIGGHIHVYVFGSRTEGHVLTLDNFTATTGMASPGHWLRFRILSGDQSDGISGVGRVGKKTAQRLVERGWPEPGFLGDREAEHVWWANRRALVTRNAQLMDLRVSAKLYTINLRIGEVRPEVTLPTPDLRAARAWLDRANMAELTARWSDWSTPFRVLEAAHGHSPQKVF